MKPALPILLACWSVLSAAEVLQPAHVLPVAREVDVVVVGGSSGAVAAAVAAAASGASVFLVAPKTYLGDDLAGQYQLWTAPGDQPLGALAQAVFQASATEGAANGLPFTYRLEPRPSAKHPDTETPSLLNDGRWQDAKSQSVQFDGDATVTLDLGRVQALRRVRVMAYQRPGAFAVATVVISASDDQASWRPVATIRNQPGESDPTPDAARSLTAEIAVSTRHLRLHMTRPADTERILLGEIQVEGDGTAPPAPLATGRAMSAAITPMQAKHALDQALIAAGVPFLSGCFATDLLRDGAGHPAGIVMANRSGRQAVLAKVIIDATPRASVARWAGATCTPFPAGPQTFTRVLVGGAVADGAGVSVRPAPVTVNGPKGVSIPVAICSLDLAMADGSMAAFQEAEQAARDRTWNREQLDASEELALVPPDAMRGTARHAAAWSGVAALPLDAFRPAGVPGLYVLGGCADVDRATAAALLRPVQAMALGERIGAAAAAEAKAIPALTGVQLPAGPRSPDLRPGQVQEIPASTSARWAGGRTIPAAETGVPVLGSFDVVVVGGGTGGAPAALAAGRHGAKTLLVEYLSTLGGVGTVGLVSIYYHGFRQGFTKEIDTGVAAFDPAGTSITRGTWMPDRKAEWFRQELRKAGVTIWFATMGVGAVVEQGRVRGVEIATAQGRGVVLARTVIDATGGADVAAAAGATCTTTTAHEIAVQGTGLPPRQLGTRGINTDYTYVDETDVLDIWRAHVLGREKYRKAYDLGQLIDTRERRRIIGDIELSPMDAMNGRTWPDTVVMARSNFDSHGYTVDPLFLLRAPDKKSVDVAMPYRCLLPRGLDGIIVIGLGVSVHRDALPLVRMQADIQNQGYAMGTAASMLAKSGQSTRALDVKALQSQLVEKGNLPETVLTSGDSFPLSRERFLAAVATVVDDGKGLEVLLTRPDEAKPLLKKALAEATTPEHRLAYARILGMLGDAAGVDALIQAVATASWDKGWPFVSMGQFGASISPVDGLIIALGRSGDRRGVAPIVARLRQLAPDSDFSHFRAVALALESLGDPAAAAPLAELLHKPGMMGHAVTGIQELIKDIPASGTDTTVRRSELIELSLARALYRCGDHEGLGEKILRQYAQDLHGYYARHAQAVLAERKR